MQTALNIIWIVFSGFWLALGFALAGVIMCVLIITIPFGLQAFKLAEHSLWPFGRTAVKKPDTDKKTLAGNILWLILFGWWLAVEHVVAAVLLAITVIGFPLAVENIKLIPASLWPFGREIVTDEEAAVMAKPE